MLRTILITGLAAGLLAGENSAQPKTQNDATDKTGKVRQTPFGVVKATGKSSKTEPKSEGGKAPTPFGPVNSPAPAERLKIIDRGATLDFERPSPFGSYRWTRQKSELTPEEQAAWDRFRNQSSSPGPKE